MAGARRHDQRGANVRATSGGRFRISLTYDDPAQTGKSSAQTDTYHGVFVKLVPDSEVVQVLEFETDDPEMQGEMTITYRLHDVEGGTEVVGLHEDLPAGISPDDNELGWRISIGKLASLVEGRSGPASGARTPLPSLAGR